jgi:hypothetical protein
MLWKKTPQQFIVKDMICMKKLLAICSIFFTVCTTLTSCGDNNSGHYTDDGNGAVIDQTTTTVKHESTTTTMHKSTVKDRAEDAADGIGDAGKDIVSGVGDAGKDLIDGAQNAVDNVIDGMDGEKETKTTTTHRNDR